MKTQAVLYHNTETDYLAGVVLVDTEGDKDYPRILAAICEDTMTLAGGKDKFISCVQLEENKWEIRVDLTTTSEAEVDRFMGWFNNKGLV